MRFLSLAAPTLAAAVGLFCAALPAQNAALPETTGETTLANWFMPERADRFSAVAPGRDYRLMLRYREFDPLGGEPVVPPDLLADAYNRLFIVQFVDPIRGQHRAGLRRLGAEIKNYLPFQSYLVRADRSVAAAVRELPYVRWVGDFHTAYKLEPEILAALTSGTRMGVARYNIVLVDKQRDTARLESTIQELGGVVVTNASGGILVEATLTPRQLMAVARQNTVIWIDRYGAPEVDMDNARVQSGALHIETVAGIDGKGMRGHIVEGVHASHPEFAARPPYREAPYWLLDGAATGHGTNTAGEVFAQGLQPRSKGMLPYAQMMYTNYNAILGTNNRYSLTRRLVAPTQGHDCLIQTASWGYPRSTTYTSRSAEMDDIIHDHDMFVTQSQSNSGGTPSRPQAWAKNICSVGGFRHYDNSNPNDDCWCNTGSTGPASDGRIGVTVTGYYDNIYTTSGGSSYTSGFGGTSGATPICNGLGGLALQMFTEGLFGYPGGPWGNRFDRKPHFSTTKMLLAATTRQIPFNRARRVEQGWGFPNVRDLYDERDTMLVLDQEDTLPQNGRRSYFVFVKPGTTEFRAAMHYPDPETQPPYTVHRVNSLDLSVRDPGGTLYWGNNGLLASHYSASGGSANDRDTEELVILQNPPAGIYRVKVAATAIRTDGNQETEEMDATFALVVRGIGGGRDRSGMVMDLSSSQPGELKVSLTNLPAGWADGFTLFSLNTERHTALGNVLGLESDDWTIGILGRTPATGNIYAFTSGASGSQYPNAQYCFPASFGNELRGRNVDAVAFVRDQTGAIIAASNVDRVTVQ